MKLLEAKKLLYHLLLTKGSDNVTDNELEIMCLLAKDEEIQTYLEKCFKI